MKKILAFLLVTILLIGTCAMVTSAYTVSPEANGVISGVDAEDSTGEKVQIEFTKIDGKVIKEFADALDELKKESENEDLKIIAQYNVKIKGSPKYPVRVSLKVLGISKSSTAYVLVTTKDGQVKAIEATVSDGKLVFDITENVVKLAVVVDKKTADSVEKENDIKSPQTSDYTKVIAFVLVASLMATAFVYKKVKE